jgi:hypothetical protein
MTVAAEDRKVDLVQRLAAEARNRVPPEDAESASSFIWRYFALIAPDDIIYTSFDTLLGGRFRCGNSARIASPASRKYGSSIRPSRKTAGRLTRSSKS